MKRNFRQLKTYVYMEACLAVKHFCRLFMGLIWVAFIMLTLKAMMDPMAKVYANIAVAAAFSMTGYLSFKCVRMKKENKILRKELSDAEDIIGRIRLYLPKEDNEASVMDAEDKSCEEDNEPSA